MMAYEGTVRHPYKNCRIEVEVHGHAAGGYYALVYIVKIVEHHPERPGYTRPYAGTLQGEYGTVDKAAKAGIEFGKKKIDTDPDYSSQ